MMERIVWTGVAGRGRRRASPGAVCGGEPELLRMVSVALAGAELPQTSHLQRAQNAVGMCP